MGTAPGKVWEEGQVPGEYPLIFVTVGTHTQSFDRLIVKMDEIAGKIGEEVTMQTGCSDYRPVHARYFQAVDSDRFVELCRDARLIICHAGAGTILTAVRQNKPLLVLPRLVRYAEAIDDHQLEIAEAMDGHHRVKAVYDIEDLEGHINDRFDIETARPDGNRLSDALRELLPSLSR